MDAIHQQHDIWAAQFRYYLENNPNAKKTRCCNGTRLMWSRVREKTQLALLSKYTEWLLWILIIIHIFALGLRIPQYEGSPTHTAGEAICITCNVLFLTEAALKMIAWGLFRQSEPHPRPPFFRSVLNIVDLVIIIWQLVDSSARFLAVLRVGRLVVMGSSDVKTTTFFKLLCGAIVMSLYGILFVLAAILFQCAWWGILGVWLFSGLTHQRCYDDNLDPSPCCNSTNNTVCTAKLSAELPCATTTGKPWEGDNYCAAGTCAVRDCFQYGILNYDNIAHASVNNLRLMSSSNNWYSAREHEACAGWWFFWYFIIAPLAGYYVTMLAMAVLLKNYTALSRLPHFQSVNEQRDYDEPPQDRTARMGTGERMRANTRLLVESKGFKAFMVINTVISVVGLALYWYGVPHGVEIAGNVIYWVCSAFFFAEFFLKIFVYRFRYFHDLFNILDFVLVIVNLLAFIQLFVSPLSPIVVFRGLRALRLLHIFDFITLGLRARTMNVAWLSCVPRYALLEVVHFGLIWIFAIVGCNFMYGITTPPGYRYSYDTLLDAIITTYALSTGEQWPAVVQWTVEESNDWWFAVKFITWTLIVVVTGIYLLPALFFAVQVRHFQATMEEVITEQNVFSEYSSRDPRAKALARLLHGKFEYENASDPECERELVTFAPVIDPIGPRPPMRSKVDCPQPRSDIQKGLAEFVVGNVFQAIVNGFIVLQCFWTTLVNSRQDDTVLTVAEVFLSVCLAVSGIEIGLKIYVLGPRRYLRFAWNIFDVIVFGLALGGLWLPALNFAIWLRLFHLVRLYMPGRRVHTVLFGSNRVYGTVCTAFGLIVCVSLAFALIGIRLFAGRFNMCLRCPPDANGDYYQTDCTVVSDSLHYCNQTLCEAPPYNTTGGTLQVWSQTITTFDDMYMASVSLLRLFLWAQWTDLLYAGMDVQGIGECLNRDSSEVNFLFFIAYIIVGSYILKMWFLAVVAYSMSSVHLAVPAFEALNMRYQTWLTYVLNVLRFIRQRPQPSLSNRLKQAEPPSNRFMRMLFKLRLRLTLIAWGKPYAVFLCLIETFYFGVLCSMHWRQPDWLGTFQSVTGQFVVVVWLFDFYLRTSALGKAYFSVGLYVFQFCALIADVVGCVLHWAGVAKQYPYGFIRLSWLLHLINVTIRFCTDNPVGLPFFRMRPYYVLQVLDHLIPQLIAIFLIFGIFVASYSTIAVPLFEDLEIDGVVLTNHTNFQNFYKGIRAVSQMAGGEFWVYVMALAQMQPPFCTDGTTCPAAGSHWIVPVAPMFSFVLFSLLTATVFDFVAQLSLDAETESGLSMEDLHKYTHAWSRLDPTATGEVAPKSAMLLWQYIRASQDTYSKGPLHAGLSEYRPEPGFLETIRFPVILWPINRNCKFMYWEGVAALISTICSVGYIEHRLLQQLVDPGSRLPTRFFFTVTHAILALNLDRSWKAFRPIKVDRLRYRYGLQRLALKERARLHDDTTEDLLLSDLLFWTDSEDLDAPTPCHTPEESVHSGRPGGLPWGGAGAWARDDPFCLEDDAASEGLPDRRLSSRVLTSARAIRALVARRRAGRARLQAEAHRIREIVLDPANPRADLDEPESD